MAPALILLVGAIYLATAADFFARDKPGMGVVFVGYALANAGLWWAER